MTHSTTGSGRRVTGSSGGLASPGTATVIDSRGDEAVFTDGPFVETKEHIAGIWIMKAPDLDVALRVVLIKAAWEADR